MTHPLVVAEDAAALVNVAFDPLPAAADCRDAAQPDAPLVHSNADHNICAEFDMAYGDVDAAFDKAAHVFRENLKMHRGGSHSMECRGCVAQHDANIDQTILWSSTQMPHSLRTTFIDMTGRDEGTIRVCEECDAPYHCTCHRPPLIGTYEEGDWLCAECAPAPSAPPS